MDKIVHYEVTKGYGKAIVGLRFSAVMKSSRGADSSIAEGLAKALNIKESEASTIRCNIKYKEI